MCASCLDMISAIICPHVHCAVLFAVIKKKKKKRKEQTESVNKCTLI